MILYVFTLNFNNWRVLPQLGSRKWREKEGFTRLPFPSWIVNLANRANDRDVNPSDFNCSPARSNSFSFLVAFILRHRESDRVRGLFEQMSVFGSRKMDGQRGASGKNKWRRLLAASRSRLEKRCKNNGNLKVKPKARNFLPRSDRVVQPLFRKKLISALRDRAEYLFFKLKFFQKSCAQP